MSCIYVDTCNIICLVSIAPTSLSHWGITHLIWQSVMQYIAEQGEKLMNMLSFSMDCKSQTYYELCTFSVALLLSSWCSTVWAARLATMSSFSIVFFRGVSPFRLLLTDLLLTMTNLGLGLNPFCVICSHFCMQHVGNVAKNTCSRVYGQDVRYIPYISRTIYVGLAQAHPNKIIVVRACVRHRKCLHFQEMDLTSRPSLLLSGL